MVTFALKVRFVFITKLVHIDFIANVVWNLQTKKANFKALGCCIPVQMETNAAKSNERLIFDTMHTFHGVSEKQPQSGSIALAPRQP
jgi:hypothetical protein